LKRLLSIYHFESDAMCPSVYPLGDFVLHKPGQGKENEDIVLLLACIVHLKVITGGSISW